MTDNTIAKRKRTNNDLQITTPKTRDRETQTLLKTGGNSGAPEGFDRPHANPSAAFNNVHHFNQ